MHFSSITHGTSYVWAKKDIDDVMKSLNALFIVLKVA